MKPCMVCVHLTCPHAKDKQTAVQPSWTAIVTVEVVIRPIVNYDFNPHFLDE